VSRRNHLFRKSRARLGGDEKEERCRKGKKKHEKKRGWERERKHVYQTKKTKNLAGKEEAGSSLESAGKKERALERDQRKKGKGKRRRINLTVRNGGQMASRPGKKKRKPTATVSREKSFTGRKLKKGERTLQQRRKKNQKGEGKHVRGKGREGAGQLRKYGILTKGAREGGGGRGPEGKKERLRKGGEI